MEPRVGTIARGVRGRIQLGPYAIAADVNGYVVERDARQRTLVHAHLQHDDEYKMRQSPLAFILTLERGEWEWPIVEVLWYREHAFMAVLGAAVPVIRRSA